jgi:hypothetical protein
VLSPVMFIVVKGTFQIELTGSCPQGLIQATLAMGPVSPQRLPSPPIPVTSPKPPTQRASNGCGI